jgi:hypothetical protein
LTQVIEIRLGYLNVEGSHFAHGKVAEKTVAKTGWIASASVESWRRVIIGRR